MVFTLCSVIPMMAEQSVEVQAVLNILRNLYGHKIISSSMANVDWNCTEAENVFKWTGKYPALNTFDFIHYEVSADKVERLGFGGVLKALRYISSCGSLCTDGKTIERIPCEATTISLVCSFSKV